MTVRKNFRLDQAKLDRARRILGTQTEAETVNQALDLVVLRNETIEGVPRMTGAHGVRDTFSGNGPEEEESLLRMFNAAWDSLSEAERATLCQEREL